MAILSTSGWNITVKTFPRTSKVKEDTEKDESSLNYR